MKLPLKSDEHWLIAADGLFGQTDTPEQAAEIVHHVNRVPALEEVLRAFLDKELFIATICPSYSVCHLCDGHPDECDEDCLTKRARAALADDAGEGGKR